MHENTRKSFYVFLSMVLGVLLFLMLQRAAFLVAFLVGVDIGSVPSQALGAVTSMIAAVFGAWYGIWLGLTWYAAVYEEQHVKSMFHWLWNSAGSSPRSAGAWQFDELLETDEAGSPLGAHLEFFEANTVQFGGRGAASVEEDEDRRVPVTARKVATKRPARKSAAKKSVS